MQDGRCIYFEKNGSCIIIGHLKDEKLTDGIELTDSILVTVRGLAGGGKYYIRIRAIGKSRYGKWSKKIRVCVK